MAWLRRIAIAAIACGSACGGDDDGALVTLRAPNGPISASRIEIVLANAEPGAISLVDDQRLRPDSAQTGTAIYYRQRETGGVLENIARVDGFVVRIAPNTERVPDATFVPFVLAFDDADKLVGIGAFLDDAGKPAPIAIADGRRDHYDIDVIPFAGADLAAGIAERQSAAFECETFASGIAWQWPADEQQMRLLFPEAGAFDATTRLADLDCDQQVAPDDDCDDLHASTHVDAAESCDGIDANCDGQRLYLERCDSTCGPQSGVSVCRDVDAGAQSSCVPDVQCRCSAGGAGCFHCDLFHHGPTETDRTLCAPADRKIGVGCNGECDVEVIPSLQPWKTLLSLDAQSYSRKVTTTNGLVHVKVEYLGSSPVDGTMPDLGTIHLVITEGSTSRYLGIQLRLAQQTGVDSCEPPSNGAHDMICTVGQ